MVRTSAAVGAAPAAVAQLVSVAAEADLAAVVQARAFVAALAVGQEFSVVAAGPGVVPAVVPDLVAVGPVAAEALV